MVLKSEFHVDSHEFDFLIGKRIVKVLGDTDQFKLITADDEVITIKTNEGCGGCTNGWSELPNLKLLEDADNAIMNVTSDYLTSNSYEEDQFKLFVYYHNKVLEVQGDEGYGNGYYGGGFWVTIVKVESEA